MTHDHSSPTMNMNIVNELYIVLALVKIEVFWKRSTDMRFNL